ncbi:lipopolysaccharide heptosyltransferase II [Gallionella capsiferriformans]|jgi:heptosyltransferase-2|uniref:lipopolysaccharide heptosyltransferase II n=1 Tax=Gallionella capsiferriformans (strain ES-2) TaxID=395494 RepID=D9SC92_GALCS|nr:lipopolysaccharide heptosyltransferase II [Gallionella capsiferriformans]ADL54557.1 lipopolysaccharide heptosyltransferase II [Gallionella capsiferriformans ES-2]
MHKILVIGPSWVGDCMLMQPMLMRLKQRHPGCLIDVLAPAWTAGLLHALPEVNQAIVNPFGHGALNIKERYRLGVELRAGQYDQAIVLPNSLKSALIPFFANIPLRTGFVGELRYGLLNDARPLNKHHLPLMVERFAELAEDRFGIIPRPLANPKLSVSAAQRDTTLTKLGLTLEKPVAVFCPGAEYGPAKRWPIAYFAEIAQRLHAQGYAVWLVGSNKDREVAEKIVALGNPDTRNLCGSTDLSDAIALLSVATLVISNDSGLMHLAAALDRTLIALFGSSSPEFTPPLSNSAQVVKLDIKCSPCFKRECPLGHFNCMNHLTPDLVWQKIHPVL